MTTMSKKSALSDTMRSAQEFTLSSGTNQALAKAAEAWFATTTECQREMIGFMSMRLEKDGEAAREMHGLQEPCGRDGHPIPLDRGDPARLQRRDDQADDHLHQVGEQRPQGIIAFKLRSPA